MQDILIQTLRTGNTGKRNGMDEKLEMVVNYLNEYCTTEIDFHVLADSMNYSYDYLRHCFKKSTGMSMKQYVVQRKVELSKGYLNSGMSVKQIAAACAFSSPAHYASVFRQITGMSPTEFRDKCRTIITDKNDPIWYEQTDLK